MFLNVFNIGFYVKPARLNALPEDLRRELKEARRRRGWSQAELGARIGRSQAHVYAIEAGRIVPRFDTLLELVRALDQDVVMIPQSLVPAVQALVRDHARAAAGEGEERPLYAVSDDEESENGSPTRKGRS